MPHVEVTADIRVKPTHNGYITNRVKGKQASCTIGPEVAAQKLGEKLFGKSLLLVESLPMSEGGLIKNYRLHAEPVYAYCWASGLIDFGKVVPEGAIRFAMGIDKELQEHVAALAREGMGASKGKLLVPGIPEAKSPNDAVDALIAWVGWAKKGNGAKHRGRTVFIRGKQAA
jgi:hypothetical protein